MTDVNEITTHELELIDELARVRIELAQVRAEAEATLLQCAHALQVATTGNARLILALDAALQWGEALFAWVPEGTVLPEGVSTAKGALTEALREIRR